MKHRIALVAVAVAGLLGAGTLAVMSTASAAVAADPAPALHVDGNRLVTGAGATYRLLGVNRASAEFACVQGKGIWDSPQPDQASVDAMKTWNIHAVRIPLNEDCWLGTFGTPSGTEYQTAVAEYVDLLVANGINPILDLHWTHGVYTGTSTACADVNATCQKPMPNAEFTPKFWTSVASTFKGNDAVLFDLFNEPYPDAANNWADMTAAWKCLRDGGTCTGITYQVAGMQSLVDAVRSTGATNVLLVAGLTWTNDLTQWLAYKPSDPRNNIVASWHSYNFNACVTEACWDSQIAPVAAQVPVQAGEIGQNTCAHDYIDRVMAWADKNGVGYTAWTWNPWGCSGGNVLIDNYDGTPTQTFGEGVKAHLLTVNPTTTAVDAPVRIMPLGDSITAGTGCWRAKLWHQLQEGGHTNIDFVGGVSDYGGCNPGYSYDFDHEGHGGFSATGIAANNQLPPWLAANTPDIILMHLGTNDMWGGYIPLADKIAAFTKLVGQMRAANPNVKIIVAQIIPMSAAACATCPADVKALNDAIPGWAAGLTTAQSPITVADLWTGYDAVADNQDGVHPNDGGYQKMANAWYPVLSAALGGQ